MPAALPVVCVLSDDEMIVVPLTLIVLSASVMVKTIIASKSLSSVPSVSLASKVSAPVLSRL